MLSRSRFARRPLARMAVMGCKVPRLRATLHRNAWLDSGFLFCVSSWRLLENFLLFLRAGVHSDPMVDVSIAWLARAHRT